MTEYYLSDLLDITGETKHLLKLVNYPPVSSDDEIFGYLDSLKERLKFEVKGDITRMELKEVISTWIGEKIEEKAGITHCDPKCGGDTNGTTGCPLPSPE